MSDADSAAGQHTVHRETPTTIYCTVQPHSGPASTATTQTSNTTTPNPETLSLYATVKRPGRCWVVTHTHQLIYSVLSYKKGWLWACRYTIFCSWVPIKHFISISVLELKRLGEKKTTTTTILCSERVASCCVTCGTVIYYLLWLYIYNYIVFCIYSWYFFYSRCVYFFMYSKYLWKI